MNQLLAPVNTDYPIRVVRVEQNEVVDDEKSNELGEGIDFAINREFNVITNGSKNELSLEAFLFQVPEFSPGRVLTDYPRRRIGRVRLRNTASDCLYILEAELVPYKFKTPFHVPIDWEYETAYIDIPAQVDRNGRPIVTTAGEPILGLTKRLKLWVLKGTRNVPDVPNWLPDYGVSVNSDRIRIEGRWFDPNYLQLQRMSLGKFETTEIGGNTYAYRPLSVELWWNPLTWSTEVLNLGFSELMIREEEVEIPNSNGQTRTVRTFHQVRATNAEGDETKHRVFLNRQGLRPRDAEGNIRENLTARDIVTLKFDLDDALPYKPIVS